MGDNFGAGNIGRGFLGQLFSNSDHHVAFVAIDRPLLDALNRQGRYTVRLVTNESSDEVNIGPVQGLFAGDREAVARALTEAELGATALIEYIGFVILL